MSLPRQDRTDLTAAEDVARETTASDVSAPQAGIASLSAGTSTRAATSQGAPPKPSTGRPRRHTRQGGFSLLARGEPQIWFTGGMLVVCLAMILGLLGLILAYGLPTFWPRSIELIALNDGSLDIGQPQKQQIRSVSSLTADESKPELPRLPSRYYRTGNYDLTGRHYRWLDPPEANQSGISRPEAALVVERIEKGYLYGLPLQYQQILDLAAADRQALDELEEVRRLLESITAGDQAEVLQEMQAALANAHAQTRDQAFRRSIQSRDKGQPSSAFIQVHTGDGTWQRLSALENGQLIAEARLLITDPSELQTELQAGIARGKDLRHQVAELRYEISRLDARISKSRAAVRRAELDSEVNAARRPEQSQARLEQLHQLGRREATLAVAEKWLRQILANDPEKLASALSVLIGYRSTEIPMAREELKAQLDEFMEPVLKQPARILEAIEDYQADYRRIIDAKLPLQRELEHLERQMGTASIRFAVPVSGTNVEGLSASDLSDLNAAKLNDGLREKFSAMSIEAAALSTLALNMHTQLVTVTETQGGTHMLALTAPGYVDEPYAQISKATLLSENTLDCSQIVRAAAVNQLGFAGKMSVYLDRWREFLTESPREGTEGGVFPAIWGMVVLTLIMTIFVVPFGVMAALYLREYTHPGPLVSLIRISINNLAGVPSIVYGVFAFSFFCYLIGAYIDGGAKNADIIPLPPYSWFLTLAAAAMLGTAAFFFGIFGSGPTHQQSNRKRWFSKIALILWVVSIAVVAYLILKSPFFNGFFREYLPNPTFGKGGLLWAALTLSLLTLPVVIVATEEALAAVPNSLREGSLACGASKWQTIRRITLPHARPGILTGAILAMARGAGEVAPLMLVGALPFAPDLPLDGEFPFFHGSRSFMHLGYQIYTLGFQSPNSEAAKPMVFTCALLLIAIVAMLNLSAVYLRAQLRKLSQGNQF